MTTADPFTIPDTKPGARILGEPAPAPVLPEMPTEAPKADTPPKPSGKRPTTRAGRAAAAAAKKAQGKTADKTKPITAKPKPRQASLETRLAGSLATLGTVIAGVGSAVSPAYTADGILIVEHSTNIAAALDKVAKDQPQVAAALERMLTVGTWSGLTAALLPVAIGIAANHGAIPTHLAAMFGTEAATPEAPAGG